MIPIVALGNLVSAIAATTITAAIFIRSRTDQKADPIVRDFIIFFFLLSIFFWLVALPGIVIFDTTVSGITDRVSNFFVLLASGYFFTVPLRILGLRPSIRHTLLPTIIIVAAIISFFDFHFFVPSMIKSEGIFYHFFPRQQPVIRTLQGGITMTVALLGSLFFYIYGARSFGEEHRPARRRSFFIATGMVFLMAAAALNYIIFTFLFSFPFILTASMLAVAGLLIIGTGILFLKPAKDHSSDVL